ncbi:hypothetical protein [Curtobacterium aurantiacum]|uniref:hypothetical protein n=1 Tax=Curtobacterium aurantiacum TaxID=3236919 RepID=UPI001BE00662|nr:hypothetical protein [Curtobacterium flaccumfaciens]MBT1676129.1 hypothetical protein [Curtobacterium flaccumfaciens pv. flaccumfaciens]
MDLIDRAEARSIIAEEGLRSWIWFSDEESRPDQAVINEDVTGFAVFATTERGRPEGVHHFDSESDALERYGWRVSTTSDRGTEESTRESGDRNAAVEDFVRRVEGFAWYQEPRKRPLPDRREHS